MSTVPIEANISSDQLLRAVEHLPPQELASFVRRVLILKAQREAPSLPQAESALLEQINLNLSPAQQQQYDALVARRDAGTITAEELATLIQIFKEGQMQPQIPSTLDVIYKNWRGYHEKLLTCIAPLTDVQLMLQPAEHMWPLGQTVQHIISVRAGWFSGTLQDHDEAMHAYMEEWGQRNSPARSAVELLRGLDETWAFIEARVQRWTPEDCARTFPDEWDGQVYEVSRSWVIYHVMEHDLHHGGEISLILGMNGLRAVDL